MSKTLSLLITEFHEFQYLPAKITTHFQEFQHLLPKITTQLNDFQHLLIKNVTPCIYSHTNFSNRTMLRRMVLQQQAPTASPRLHRLPRTLLSIQTSTGYKKNSKKHLPPKILYILIRTCQDSLDCQDQKADLFYAKLDCYCCMSLGMRATCISGLDFRFKISGFIFQVLYFMF